MQAASSQCLSFLPFSCGCRGWHGVRYCEEMSDSSNTALALTVVFPSHQKIPSSGSVPIKRRSCKLFGAARIPVWVWTKINTGNCRNYYLLKPFTSKLSLSFPWPSRSQGYPQMLQDTTFLASNER